MFYQLIDRRGSGTRLYVRVARSSDVGVIAPLRNPSKIATTTLNGATVEVQVAPGDGANDPPRVQLIWTNGQIAYLVLGVRLTEADTLAFAASLRSVR